MTSVSPTRITAGSIEAQRLVCARGKEEDLVPLTSMMLVTTRRLVETQASDAQAPISNPIERV